MSKISVIIPVLNEAENIQKLLIYLLTNSSRNNIAKIIVIDGGSTDDSLITIKKIIDSEPIVTLLNFDKGRAKQMNFGATHASGSILYFLHADSYPPKGFDQLIINEIEKGNNAGCFRMQFDHEHWWLRLVSWFTQFSWRSCRGGDQSQFITKSLFKELGGYDEKFTIYEDYDLINKLYVKNEFVVIQHKLISSARRYDTNGIWKLQYHFCAIYIKKWFGATADELHQYYNKKIV